jgi:ADP-sugar diphosphatase
MKPQRLSSVPCRSGPKVTPTQRKLAVASIEFHTWAAELDPRFKVKKITFQSVDMNKARTRVMFIKFVADLEDEAGNFIPGIVFMRGGSVAILPVLVCRGKPYALLCVQPRPATGLFEFSEIPAGMLDGSGDFVSVTQKEIKQETGLDIKKSMLIDLTKKARHGRGSFPSPGASAEFMHYYAFVIKVTPKRMRELKGKCTGVYEEGEQITLDIKPLDKLIYIPDDKTIVALALFNHFCRPRLSELALAA